MNQNQEEIKKKLLARVLIGADDETSRVILSLGEEMTIYRLLVVVAKIDSHLSRGLLVMKYGVTEEQARQARREANKKIL